MDPAPPTPGPGPSSPLRARAARGALWSALRHWVDPLARFAFFLMIVRLVGPEAYGLFGMAMILIGFAELLVHETLGDALVQRETLEPQHEEAVFWTLLVAGTLLALAVVAAAGPIESLFGSAEVPTLAAWLAVGVVTQALGAVPRARLRRALRYRALSLASIAALVLGGAVGVGAAWMGWGAGALVAQLLASRVAELVLFFVAARWRPRAAFSPPHLRELTRYGLGTLGLRITQHGYKELPRLFVALTLGPIALGYYQIALRIHQLVRRALVVPVTELAMPVSARIQNDPDAMRRFVEEGTRIVSLVAVPCFVGIALVAPDLIPWLVGPDWLTAGGSALSGVVLVRVAQILPLRGVVNLATAVGTSALRGAGYAGWRLALAVAQLVSALVLILWLGPRGLVFVALAMLATTLLQWPLRLWVLQKVVGLPVWPQLRALGAPLAAAAVMSAGVWPWRQALAGTVDPALLIASEIALGALLYLGIVRWIARAELERILDLLRLARARSADAS